MELTKKDTSMAKGLAILCMVSTHLFMRTGSEVYGTPLIWVEDGVPLVYYLGYLSEICVPFYCMCTGYALFTQLSVADGRYIHEWIKKKIVRFLIHFWIVCILSVAVAILFGKADIMPGSFSAFLGNFFLLEESYNGAWWFAFAYVIFLLVSPLCLKMVKKFDSRMLFLVFMCVFCVYYLCKLKYDFVGIEPYYWKGFLIKKGVDIWFVSFFYVEGMLLAKEKVLSSIKRRAEQKHLTNRGLAVITFAMVAAACLIRRSVLIYFSAVLFFLCFHLWKKGGRCERFFLFWGRHSTNIWLVHMFFYLTPFPDLVFVVKYPILSYCFMMLLCVLSSWIIGIICKPVESRLEAN